MPKPSTARRGRPIGLKRRLAGLFTRMTGFQIARAGEAWELIEPEVLKRFFSAFRVDCAFDIGANNGQYALRLRQIGYPGYIISFEPNPAAFLKLKEAAKNDRRWVVKNVALDSEARIQTFNIMKNDQFSSLHEPDHSRTGAFLEMNVVEKQVQIATETLDALFPALQERFQFSRPFLKMDTQGHDLQVVAGASQCLTEFAGLQSELSLTPLYQDTVDFSDALSIYRKHGFRLSALVPNNKGNFPNLDEVDCIMYNPKFL